MNTKLRTKAKNDFEKDFFRMMSSIVFGKTVRKHRDVKLVSTDKGSSHSLTVIQKSGSQKICRQWKLIKMNKPVYFGLPILEISMTAMYEYWYGYAKPKFGDKTKRYYRDTESFTVHVNSEGVYADLAGDVETRFDTSKYDYYSQGKTKK